MEVYVNDMLVKSAKEADYIVDLEEALNNLRRHWMKLYPSKCTFGVIAGKFLSFMVNRARHRGKTRKDPGNLRYTVSNFQEGSLVANRPNINP